MTSTYDSPHAVRAYDALHAALAVRRRPVTGTTEHMFMTSSAAPARPAVPARTVAPPKPTIDTQRFALCVHEAAHAVWAAMSGADVTECAITADGRDGVVRTADESPRAQEIAYAGIWASARWEHGARPARGTLLAAIEAASDQDRAYFARVPQPPAHIEADLEHLFPRIKALAVELYRNGSATRVDVERVLGVRPGLDVDMVAWAHRQRIDPATITVGGAA